jgi:hypothetical protein
VRSSKWGHAERNFRFNSNWRFMLEKHTTTASQLIPLFIYSALAVVGDFEKLTLNDRVEQ